MVLVGLRADRQYFDQRRPFRFRNDGRREEFMLQRFGGVFRIDAETARQRVNGRVNASGRIDPARNIIALPDGIANNVLEGLIGGDHDGRRQRLAEQALWRGGSFQQDVERQPVEQFGGLRLVQHGKARRDIGLERKLMQQPRAKSVNGLHLEPARCLQRGGKQPARAGALRRACRLSGRGFYLLIKRGVGERAPFGERAKHAVGHIGRRRLGKGDAENLRRVDAAQQQIDDALRQHMRLAGAGIGRDEGRRIRVGRFDLHAAYFGGNDAGCAHSPPSSPPPPSDHSLTRARWS